MEMFVQMRRRRRKRYRQKRRRFQLKNLHNNFKINWKSTWEQKNKIQRKTPKSKNRCRQNQQTRSRNQFQKQHRKRRNWRWRSLKSCPCNLWIPYSKAWSDHNQPPTLSFQRTRENILKIMIGLVRRKLLRPWEGAFRKSDQNTQGSPHQKMARNP